MIGRPVKGTGFRGLLNYLGDKEHARRVGGDMAGRNARELAHEFGILRRQRPTLNRAVAHMFLRPAPGEFLSEPQWRTIASYYLAGMGFSDSPHVLYLEEQPHPHLHIVASRITYGGRVVSDSNDYARSAGLLRNIEKSYGLRVVSTHPELPSPKPGDYNRAKRTQTPPLKSHLQDVLARVTFPLTLRDYLEHLHRHGIVMLPNIARTGRVSGISYVYEGQVMKASALGRQHTWAALANRLLPTADDPVLLATEREHAQRSLAPGDSSPTSSIPTFDRPSPSGGPAVEPAFSAPDRRLFSRLAVAEEALLSSSPADYVDRALEYNWQASRAEHVLTASLAPSRPHSQEAELLARTLLASPGPPPTNRALHRLLRADELANDFLVDRVSRAINQGAPVLAADDSFRQAIERTLGLRRELHILELNAVALLADSAHLAPEERTRYSANATIVQNRVELARIDREIGLHQVQPELTDPGSVEALRERAEELIQSTFHSQSLLASAPGPAAPAITSEAYEFLMPFERWQPEPPTPRAAAAAAEVLEALRSAKTDLLTGAEHSEGFEKRLLAYFQASDSVRDLVLDSLDPSAYLYPHHDSILAGQEVAKHFVEDGPPREAIVALDQSAREAFRAVLDASPPPPSALTTLIDANLSLDQMAFHAALARQELPLQKDPEELRQSVFLEALQNRIELQAQHQERELLERLVRQDETYRHDLQLVDRRIDALQDAEYLEYAYEEPELAVPSVPDTSLTPYESWRLPPDPAAIEEAAGVFAALKALQDHVVAASPEELPERLWQYLSATDDWRIYNLELIGRLQRGEDVAAKDPESREYLQAARVLLADSDSLPELTPDRVEQWGRDATAARADLLNANRSRDAAVETFFENRREIDIVALKAQVAVGELAKTASSHTAEESLRYYSLLYSVELVELHTLWQQQAVAKLLPPEHAEQALLNVAYHIDRWDGDRYEHHLDNLQRNVYAAELASIDVQSLDREAAAHADSFRNEARFSPEPAFFLPPTPEDIPRLAEEAYQAFRLLESSTEQLGSSTPTTYLSLAISNAAHAAVVERFDQLFATFGDYPVPRNLPQRSLEAYLQTRLQLHDALGAPPSRDRDIILDSLNDRLSALEQGPPQLPPRLDGDLAQEHRRAYHDLAEFLAGRPKDLTEFRDAVSHALGLNEFLQLASAHLEGSLHARTREHALLSSRLEGLDPADHPRLLELDHEIETLRNQFHEVRLALLDRDLNLLGSYLQQHDYSSSNALDRYTQLLHDQHTLASHLDPNPAFPAPKSPQPDLADARQTLFAERSLEAFANYKQAALYAFEHADRRSFIEALNFLDLRRTELAQILKAAPREDTSPRVAHTALRDAARGYVEARYELDDYAHQPPRRGSTFDYAAHARETHLSSSSLDRLRRSAASELRGSGSASPNAIPKPRPIDADNPGVSRSEALRLAVRRLQIKEAALKANLKGYNRLERRTPLGEKPKATPEIHRRLVGSIDAYKQALADVERLSRSRLLSPLHFLRHRVFQGRPHQALAAWTGYAAGKGLRPPQARGTLRTLGLSFAAGAAGRAVQHLATSFLRDQVHER